MRPFASTISFDEARRRLNGAVNPIARVERLRLERAAGRVAAEDVTSSIDVPPFARSAMDGYALVAADTTAATGGPPGGLRIGGHLYTGQIPKTAIVSGTCSEIATGAPLPDGADAVVMVEQTKMDGDHRVLIAAAATTGQNVGRRGADISTGAVVVRRGDMLNPGRVGAVAAVGRGE